MNEMDGGGGISSPENWKTMNPRQVVTRWLLALPHFNIQIAANKQYCIPLCVHERLLRN